MFKNKMFIAMIIAIVCISALSLSGCKKDKMVSNSSNSVLSTTDLAISDPQIKKEIDFMLSEKMIDDATYNKWQTLSRDQLIFTGGLPKTLSTGIVDKSEQYIYSYPGTPDGVDGISIERRDIQEMMKSNCSSSLKMRRAANMFASVGGTITIRVVESGPNMVSLAWRQALNEAILVWNNLGTNVQFVKVTASNSTIVGGYLTLYATNNTSSPGMFAYTDPIKSPGYFSQYIYINTASTNTPDINGKKYALIHELGHAIGLMHTDAAVNNTTIFNTAVNCTETTLSNSVMYSGMSYDKLFTDFSYCDKQNINYYW